MRGNRALRRQGAHDRSVPLKNGCSPAAPEGGHSTQAGAALEGPVAAVAEDPPERAPDDDPGPTPPLAPPEELDRAEEVPPADPVPETPVLVAGVG
jgi:hypothetical protein